MNLSLIEVNILDKLTDYDKICGRKLGSQGYE